MIEVVAALIWQDDKFLICQRPYNKSRALLWEFVGGKKEIGETKEDALKRECMEELAIEIQIVEELMQVQYSYPDISINLTLFSAKILKNTPQKLEHNDIKWITPQDIDMYKFCPADEKILDLIKKKSLQ